MFLFEGNFGNILHTGDCRLTPDCLQWFPEKYIRKKGKEPGCQLDYVFLDCTFGRFKQKFPSKHSAIQQVINCIWKHPAAAMVYLTCDLLGQEDILVHVSQTFGSKIYVDKAANPECFQALTVTVPQILTQDPTSRFHVFDGFPKLYERAATKLAEAQANCQPEPLIIRPSAQWYACDCEEEDSDTKSRRKLRFNEAVRDQFGVWHVCYSMHSSREELEWALNFLAPKWVVSTTPPCRATELDYVRQCSVGAHLTSNDSIWKLLDISVGASAKANVSAKHSQISLESELPTVEDSSSQPLSLSSPIKKPALTLFGRARLPVGAFENHDCSSNEKLTFVKDHVIAKQEVGVVEASKVEIHVPNNFVSSSIGSSRNFSEALRKSYRSMNVPMPRPLPSLVELKGANKQNKRRMAEI
ncbi:uncharacterized protein LOC126655915 isoform X2 [Mercurialis annua]|nr:uncharacterized protein LOC126655915 isoform X2 [Mercurialis annua]XP_055959827.1 uncharacterized protein LOC126655915 isoform X2 [Mercurialis annua]